MFPAEPVPESIGSYKIVRRLAGTGVAEVYLAKAQGPMGFARECELKLLPDTSDGDASYAEELAREAAICAKLNHPAVVRVFDFFEHRGKLVLALEHVEGFTLAEIVNHLAEKHTKLGDSAIFHLGGKIAGALADAHAAHDEQGNATPIIHRNLSPETVLISVDGEVRLTGFGVGKILGRTPDTAIGRIKGTPGYMAPEQARGEPVTTKADVYGLGLLLWSLLAGKRPPTDGTWPRRISNLRGDLPKEVAAVLDAALDHFPGTRKISARELEQWLSKAGPSGKGKNELREAVLSVKAETKEVEPPPPSSRRRIAAVASPYQGVRFGPGPGASGKTHAPPSSAPPSPAARVPAPGAGRRTGARPEEPASSPGAALGVRVRSRLPTVSGIGDTEGVAPVKAPTADPAPAARARDVALPPSAPRPAAPLVGNDSQTLPSRNLVPANTVADVEVDAPSADDGEPISIDGEPTVRPPALRPPVPRAPGASPAAPPVLLAPVLPPAPPPAVPAPPPPPAATPAPATVAFGAPPIVPTPAPATVAFGAPPIAVTPPPATVAFGAPPVVATPPPSSVSFGAPPAVLPIPLPPPPEGRRAPMPSLLTIGPGRRSLSAMGAIVVSALTATVVVVVALIFFVGRDKGAAGAASASASAPVVAVAPPSAAPAPTAKATAAATSEPGAAELPYGFGYLTVTSPANANVYVSGKLAGPVNKALKVRCGRWFIRLAAPSDGHYPEWVSAGETVVVPCQENTRLDMSPKRP